MDNYHDFKCAHEVEIKERVVPPLDVMVFAFPLMHRVSYQHLTMLQNLPKVMTKLPRGLD
jgi:hypothetical protein